MGEGVRQALAPLLTGLEADGYAAAVRETPDVVFVQIKAVGESCAECLTPRTVMEPLILGLLRDAGYRQTLELTYPDAG